MYRRDDMGLKNVWLANGYTLHDTPYGRGVSFKDVEGLTRAVCLALARKPGKRTGYECRYLRQASAFGGKRDRGGGVRVRVGAAAKVGAGGLARTAIQTVHSAKRLPQPTASAALLDDASRAASKTIRNAECESRDQSTCAVFV